MGAGCFHIDIMTHNDAVELRYGAVAVKAGWSLDQPVMVEREFRKRAAIRPLVEIAHQHGRQMMGRTVEPGEQSAYLPSPPKPGEIEMRTDDAQRVSMDDQISQHRAARFERGQRNNFAMPHFNPATDE